jgi:hypothetical protein
MPVIPGIRWLLGRNRRSYAVRASGMAKCTWCDAQPSGAALPNRPSRKSRRCGAGAAAPAAPAAPALGADPWDWASPRCMRLRCSSVSEAFLAWRRGRARTCRSRRSCRSARSPRSPQPDRPLRGRRVDHGTSLRDLQVATGDHAARGSSGRLHQVAPPLIAHRSCGFGRADRGVLRSRIEQRGDDLFELAVGRGDAVGAASARAILYGLPVVGPLRSPFDAAPAGGACLVGSGTSGVRIGGLSLPVSHGFYPAGSPGRAPSETAIGASARPMGRSEACKKERLPSQSGGPSAKSTPPGGCRRVTPPPATSRAMILYWIQLSSRVMNAAINPPRTRNAPRPPMANESTKDGGEVSSRPASSSRVPYFEPIVRDESALPPRTATGRDRDRPGPRPAGTASGRVRGRPISCSPMPFCRLAGS